MYICIIKCSFWVYICMCIIKCSYWVYICVFLNCHINELNSNRDFTQHHYLPYYYSIRGVLKDGFTYVLYINGGHPPWTLLYPLPQGGWEGIGGGVQVCVMLLIVGLGGTRGDVGVGVWVCVSMWSSWTNLDVSQQGGVKTFAINISLFLFVIYFRNCFFFSLLKCGIGCVDQW